MLDHLDLDVVLCPQHVAQLQAHLVDMPAPRRGNPLFLGGKIEKDTSPLSFVRTMGEDERRTDTTQDAPRWERQSPRTVSQKTLWDASGHLLPNICQGDGGSGVFARAGARLYASALSRVFEPRERCRRLISATARWQQAGWHLAWQTRRVAGRSQPRGWWRPVAHRLRWALSG